MNIKKRALSVLVALELFTGGVSTSGILTTRVSAAEINYTSTQELTDPTSEYQKKDNAYLILGIQEMINNGSVNQVNSSSISSVKGTFATGMTIKSRLNSTIYTINFNPMTANNANLTGTVTDGNGTTKVFSYNTDGTISIATDTMNINDTKTSTPIFLTAKKFTAKKHKKSSGSKTYPNGVHVSASGKVSVDWGGVAQGILGAFGNSLGHAY